jgi:tetratricopeptide (TPR) repeat protein
MTDLDPRSRALETPRASLVILALTALTACAHVPLDRPEGDAAAAHAPPRELARAGFDAYVKRNDAATAARRFEEAARRDPRDPWAHFGAALLARRRLDDAAEVKELVLLVDGAPSHPLAPAAARRLGELAGLAPPLALAVESGLAPVQGRLAGLAALRVRSARATAAAALGDRERAEALRAEIGAVTAWTLVGPFGALHALEIDTRFAPEEGTLPESTAAPAGLPPVPARAIPCPDGTLSLEGEPASGDIFYLAAEATLARGGEYLLTVGGTTTLRAFVDGAPVVERRAYAAFPPLAQVASIALAPGRHRLLLKIGRGEARARLGVSLARADGGAADATFAPAAAALPGAAVREGRLRPVVNLAPDLVPRLEREMGPELARLVAARDGLENDREGVKALLEEALARAPDSAALLAVRAEVRREDPTLSERIARARAEADLEKALASDPGDAAARLERAELAQSGGRLDDAVAVLDGLAEADGARPRALLTRARLARARGLAEPAERLADEARRVGGDCAALDFLLDLATRRDALGRQDELAASLGRCPVGRERLAQHRRRRGDLAGALAAASEVVRAAPSRVDARLVRASLLAAGGDPRAAAEDLADLARIWPRDARIEKGRAEYLESAGDTAGARAARERALLLDSADLAPGRARSRRRRHHRRIRGVPRVRGGGAARLGRAPRRPGAAPGGGAGALGRASDRPRLDLCAAEPKVLPHHVVARVRDEPSRLQLSFRGPEVRLVAVAGVTRIVQVRVDVS